MGTSSIPLLFWVFLVLLTGCTAWLAVAHHAIKKRVVALTKGSGGKSLEETIASVLERQRAIERILGAHKEALELINARLSGSIRGLSLVRFNAFQGSGSPESFAAGFLDEQGDGFILSVLVNRNHVGVYAKPVAGFSGINQLTAEEKIALEEAKKKVVYE